MRLILTFTLLTFFALGCKTQVIPAKYQILAGSYLTEKDGDPQIEIIYSEKSGAYKLLTIDEPTKDPLYPATEEMLVKFFGSDRNQYVDLAFTPRRFILSSRLKKVQQLMFIIERRNLIPLRLNSSQLMVL